LVTGAYALRSEILSCFLRLSQCRAGRPASRFGSSRVMRRCQSDATIADLLFGCDRGTISKHPRAEYYVSEGCSFSPLRRSAVSRTIVRSVLRAGWRLFCVLLDCRRVEGGFGYTSSCALVLECQCAISDRLFHVFGAE